MVWNTKFVIKRAQGNPGQIGSNSYILLQREDKSMQQQQQQGSPDLNSPGQPNTGNPPSSASSIDEGGKTFFELVQEEDPEIEFVRHKSGRLQPKRATLPKLVELLTHEKGRGRFPIAIYAPFPSQLARPIRF